MPNISSQPYETKFKERPLIEKETGCHGDVRVYKPKKSGGLALKKTIKRETWSKDVKTVISAVEIRQPEAYTCVACGQDGLTRTQSRQVRCLPCQREFAKVRARENAKRYLLAAKKKREVLNMPGPKVGRPRKEK